MWEVQACARGVRPRGHASDVDKNSGFGARYRCKYRSEAELEVRLRLPLFDNHDSSLGVVTSIVDVVKVGVGLGSCFWA